MRTYRIVVTTRYRCGVTSTRVLSGIPWSRVPRVIGWQSTGQADGVKPEIAVEKE